MKKLRAFKNKVNKIKLIEEIRGLVLGAREEEFIEISRQFLGSDLPCKSAHESEEQFFT